MVKDVFGLAYMKVTGCDNEPIYLKAVDIVAVGGTDYGTQICLIQSGCEKEIHCTEKPEEVIALFNGLSAKQDEDHERLEEEAKAKATERFFDKFPKAKAAYLAELEEQKKCAEGNANEQ